MSKEMQLESPLGEETIDVPLSKFRTPSMEITFVSEKQLACETEEGIVVAPGEEKKPVSILHDKFYKEPGHPHHFLLVNVATKLEGKFH